MREKVVLAYSGGLDTSIIIPWLKENYNCDVIAMIADVGQGEDIDAVVEKAHKTGAAKVIVKDLRDEFLRDYVFPALRAGAEYEHKYLLGTSLARPVIALDPHHLVRSVGAVEHRDWAGEPLPAQMLFLEFAEPDPSLAHKAAAGKMDP